MRSLRAVAVLVVLAATAAACSASDEVGAPGDAGPAGPTVVVEDEWGAWFAEADVQGTFVLTEVGTDTVRVWDEVRAAEPRRPASTFKILNSMIILETNTLADVDAIVPWDDVDRGIESWNRDHSLRTGIEVSAVWLYQHLAREIGAPTMGEWVDRAGYGNGDIGGGIDRFWLDGDLRISPLEQVEFLERFVAGGLPFRTDVTEAVADILVREEGPGWRWSHKTGTALTEEPDLGWLVGTTEFDGRRFVFAMNLDLESETSVDTQLDPEVRQRLARRILEAAGALPVA